MRGRSRYFGVAVEADHAIIQKILCDAPRDKSVFLNVMREQKKHLHQNAEQDGQQRKIPVFEKGHFSFLCNKYNGKIQDYQHKKNGAETPFCV